MITPLYEDNHLFVVNKPYGLLTQPSGQEDAESLEGQCRSFLKERDGKEGAVFLHALHRLDRVTSGLVLFAKSSKSLKRLNEALKGGLFVKEYLAIVEGALPAAEGVLEHHLLHGDRQAIIDPRGKVAKLSYKVLESDGFFSLVLVQLVTGRYHQIRAQMAAVSCPIVGDSKYGATKSFETPLGIALQHVRLTVPHPITQERSVFALPDEWLLSLA